MSERLGWLILLFKYSTSLLSFVCWFYRVLKSPTIIMDLFIFPFSSVNFCFVYFESLLFRCIHIFDSYFF